MAKIEKKFSDFQKNECDEIVVEQPIDERLCPSCFPNDSFSLPDYWYNIEEAYLNEKFCEYHIRIYLSEAERERVSGSEKKIRKAAINLGIKKILIQFDKLLNNGTIESLKNVASIVNTTEGTNAKLLGKAYLIAIPSFNFDQIPDLEDEGEEDEDKDLTPPEEAIVEYKDLYKKTIQLGTALRVYDMLYAAAHQIGDNKGITLVYESDTITRVQFLSIRKSLATFRRLLNITLRENNYEGIDYPSLIRKRYRKIKFIFKKNQPFVIESIYVLDESCEEEYTKLKVKGEALQLLKPGFETISSFFANFDQVINDITAKETKPWLEFALDNIHPPLVANYGDYEKITEEDYRSISCLFDNALGFGSGQVADFLAKETLSFFKVLENDAYKSACRSINQKREPTEKNQARAKTSEDLRKERTTSKYRESFINNYYRDKIESLQNLTSGLSEDNELRNINRDNFWDKAENLLLVGSLSDLYKGPKYNYKNDAEEKKEGPPAISKVRSKMELLSSAADYAETRFELMENAWGSKFKNNADWEEMKESYNEAFNPENGFLNYLFGTEPNEDDAAGVKDERVILNTIGLCGMSKLTGEMLKCLLGGVTIEDFYDLMAEKAMEFMNVNTLGLFLNALPLSFRENLNTALSEQFGNINLEQLIGIKSEEGASVKDIVGFSKPNALMKAFERSYDPLNDPKITQEDKDFIKNNIGDGQIYETIRGYYLIEYDYDEGLFTNPKQKVQAFPPSTLGTVEFPANYIDKGGELNVEKKEYRNKKSYVKKVIKHARRSYLKGADTFAQANTKLEKTIDLFGDYDRGDSKEELERSLNSNERISKAFQQTNMGVKIDAVYDVVFDFVIDYILDLMNVDQLIQILNQFPGADLAFGFISDFLKSCPHPPLFHPPATDFMKSFSLDVCDPEINMRLPHINFPSLSLRYNLEKQFGDNFRNAIVSLVSKIAINLLKRVMNFLEDALCKTIGAIGAFVAEGVQNGNLISGARDNFEKALDELFCGGSINPDTGKSRANELANGLFQPALANYGNQSGLNPDGGVYEGSGDKISNIISSVVSQDEILRAVVDGDDRVNKMIANAINALAPEMAVLLGTPSQVATFFRNLKSYLPDDDRTRIREMLDAGIPNLPLTAQLCLTNNQLKAWNDMRNTMLQNMGLTPEEAANRIIELQNMGLSPQEAQEEVLSSTITPEEAANKVAKLNEEVLEALEQTIGDALNLDNPEGPFIGAITDEALKDVCNPENLFNDVSESELSKDEAKTLNNQTFELTLRMMMYSFNGRNGIFGNALRARDNTREGVYRNFKKFFNPNYGNSQDERNTTFDTKGVIGKAVMASLTDIGGSVIGDYPETVGILLRDELLENQTYNLPGSFSALFEEGENESYYKSRQRFVNLDKNNDFSYDFQIIQRLGSAEVVSEDYVLPIPQDTMSESEINFLDSIGVQVGSLSKPLRQEVFQKLIESRFPIQKDHSQLYNDVFESLSRKVIEASVTRPVTEENPLGVSTGYLFGYESDNIVKGDFEYLNPDGSPYDKSEDEKILGYYDHDRIKVLSPEIYGGRYVNPPYTIEPRKFSGWLEFAIKAFESQEGCDPKRPPMFSLRDIKDRVEYLENNLKNYPEMTKDKECVVERPFKLLISNKSRAKMDSVVRTTLRAYIGEYFLRGIGAFSNVQLSPENYDQSFSAYITKSMKSEMIELGAVVFNERNSISREKYWYTFLEQAVQSYQTMYDLGEVEPPSEVLEALEEISQCQMAYSGVTRSTKKRMKNIVGDLKNRPLLKNRKRLLTRPASLAIYGMDFRLADDKENYFGSGSIDSRIDIGMIRMASVKKIKFFTKLFAIRMYEKEATLVLNELIFMEAARLSETAFNGLNDKPYIQNMNKAFVGLKSIFENTNSNIGYNQFYLDKQLGTEKPGDVPSVQVNNSSAQVAAGEEVKFIVEKYIRSKSRAGVNSPLQDGVNSISEFKTELSRLSNVDSSAMMSDYFGDLEFTYQGSFRELMDKGFSNLESIRKLNELNKGSDINIAMLQNSLRKYVGSSEFEDFKVTYDSSFILEGEPTPQPTGTTGNLDVNYGLRISIVLPVGHLETGEIEQVTSAIGNLSSTEKSFIFSDGTIVIPLVITEVSAIDSELSLFNPDESYDLECLVNKMSDSVEFKLLFNKVFPLQMFNSLSAIFNSENFFPAMGRGPDERTEEALAVLEAGLDEDSWEGVTNEFMKNFLRREFRSVYLSNDIDGFSIDDLSERERIRLFGSFNPFDSFALPAINIPWFKKRRLKTKVYDANDNECADPTKDFE